MAISKSCIWITSDQKSVIGLGEGREFILDNTAEDWIFHGHGRTVDGEGCLLVIIGLTGGMACGKSAAAEAFCAEGFGSIDTDELVREILRDDQQVKQALISRYGSAVMTSAGEVDRKALAKIVFASRPDLAWLESLLHPEVDRIWRKRVSAEPERNWVVQVPLLFEAGMEGGFQTTVCVAASPGVRRARVRARGMTDVEAASRDARQLPLEKKMDLADYVIVNDGSLRFLHEQVRELLRTLKIRQ